MTETTQARRIRIGRFRLDLPDELEIASRGQGIYRVDIEALQGDQHRISRHWEDLLATIAAQPGPGQPSSIIRRFLLADRHPAVWYYRTQHDPGLVSLIACVTLSDHALILERGCERVGMGDVEQLLEMMAGAYQPGHHGGFDVGPGSFLSPPGDNEYCSLKLSHRRLEGMELMFNTHTVQHSFDVNGDLFNGAAVTVLRDQSRTVAGMLGREFIVRHDNEGLLQAVFRFGGERRSNTLPQTLLSVSADSRLHDQAMAAYEAVADSLALAGGR